MKKIILLILISTLLVGCGKQERKQEQPTEIKKIESSQVEEPVYNTTKELIEVLMTAEIFKGTAVGYAGTMPEEVKVWHSLIAREDANEIFIDIEKNGRMPGKLYALCGLYYTNPELFEEKVQEYLKNQTKVRTQYGCIGGQEDVSSVIKNKNANKLDYHGQDIWEYAKLHPESAAYDIAGGTDCAHLKKSVRELPLKVTRQELPEYPLSAIEQKTEEQLLVFFIVNKKGEVKIQRIESDKNSLFNEAVKKAVKEWKFEPVYFIGEPIKTQRAVRITFSLESDLPKVDISYTSAIFQEEE